MRLLLDSNAVLWYAVDSPRLADGAHAAIADNEHERFVSSATVWELGIKQAAGRLNLPADLVGRIADAGFRELPITFKHAAHAAQLPRHHNDPFDRMLVAQAQFEGLTIVTSDAEISRYQVAVLPAA